MSTTSASPSRIYFCDSPGEILVLTRRNISVEKRAAIKDLHRLEYRYNLKILFFAALWVAAGILHFRTTSLLLRIPTYFVMGCVASGLPVLMHEANHNLLFRNRWLNRWLGFLCGLPALVSVTAYRTIHLPHHAHTGTSQDPDNIEHTAPKSLPLVLMYYVVLLVGAYLYLFHLAMTSMQRADSRTRRNIVVEYTIIIVTFVMLFWLVPFSILLHVWLIPLIIAGQLSSVRALAEHGLSTSNNPFTDTRCVLSNRFVSFMMCNLNYHLDHHLFPGVPWYNLPRLHAILEEEYRAAGASIYRSYTAFVLDFIRVSWAGIIPQVRLIPEHLREDMCV